MFVGGGASPPETKQLMLLCLIAGNLQGCTVPTQTHRKTDSAGDLCLTVKDDDNRKDSDAVDDDETDDVVFVKVEQGSSPASQDTKPALVDDQVQNI